MSITDPEADAVQPSDEGQGAGGDQGNPLYAEYLSRMPDEARDVAEEAFKAWDANVTRQSQEHSQFRQTWEPYEQLGVSKLQPDEVQWALDFRQAAVENPAAVKEWFDQYAQQHNLIEQPPAETTTFDEFQDPSQQLEALLKQQLSPLQQQIEQVVQWRQEQEFAQRQAEAGRFIEGQLSELKAKHPDSFKDSGEYGAEKMIERLIAPYIESDPNNAVNRAFADYQAWLGHVEKQTLQSKVDAPAPAESGGSPDVSPDKLTNFKQAEAAALEFLNNANR